MIKAFLAVILLLFLIPANLSFALRAPGSVKIYSGYLYQQGVKPGVSFWHALFGSKSSKQNEVAHDRPCSIEFDSPVSFSNEPVTVVPEQLTYFIRFKNGPRFSKFIIKIFTDDDEDYTIDPASEGKQVGINDAHHVFDAYLIYLILGSDIDHIEVVSSSGNDHDKYVLDKLEIH